MSLFGTCVCSLLLKCLLPCMYRWYLIQFRLRRHINEYRLMACQRIIDPCDQLIGMCDAHAAYPKCLSNANSIHFAAEIDTEIALTIVQALQHLDPSKGAIIEQDDGNG